MQAPTRVSLIQKWFARQGLSTKVGALLMFVVPLVSNVFWGTVVQGTEANIPNRVAVLVVTLIGLGLLHRMLFYYGRNIQLLDVIAATYAGLVLIEIGPNFTLGQISGPFRMLLCFYGVAYLLRRGGSIPRVATLAVVGIGGALVWLFILLPSTFADGRVAYIGTANTSARDLLAMFSVLYLIVINKRMFGATLRRVAGVEIVAIIALMLLTGSRQGIILGIAVIWLGTKAFRGGVDLRILLRRVFQILGGSVLLAGGLYALYVTTGAGIIGRMFELSLEGNMDRIVRYTIYYKYLTVNYNDLMIGGVNLEEMFQRDGQAVRVTGEKIAAPHNAFLEVGLTRGIIPLIFYAAFHVLLIVKIFKIHNAIGGPKTSSAALSIVISAFLIGMIANYFTQVSTCLSYLFYSILGLYINFERDACRQ